MVIHVVVNTLNEETNIANCIRSIQELADEVVVCDMHKDGTVAIVQDLGAYVVYANPDYCDFGRLRFQAVSSAHYD